MDSSSSSQNTATPEQIASVKTLLSEIKTQGGVGGNAGFQLDHLIPELRILLNLRTRTALEALSELNGNNTLARSFVDFLDLCLRDQLTDLKERARALALLSRIATSTHITPHRLIIQRVEYHPRPKAAGGFGAVHQGLDPTICVKVMFPKTLVSWARELIVWAHSSHPNVLPFMGMFIDNIDGVSRVCLVSPFMENGNLLEYAPRLPQRARLSLLSDVVNGLLYIHAMGIVHGDLKGQNVLINSRGCAVITDFGSSRATTGTSTSTTTNSSYTLCFAAPEVVAHGKKSTTMSDVWSFGCLTFETLSRKPPYYQYSNVQIISVLFRKLPPKRPGAPKERERNGSDSDEEDWSSDGEEEDKDFDPLDDQMWSLIMKCCKPEPEDRLGLVAIQEQLGRIMEGTQRAIKGPGIPNVAFHSMAVATRLSSMTIPTPPPVVPQVPQLARALWSWSGEGPGDLAFAQGDIIEITRENNDNWWTGRLDDRYGLFPASYVEKIQVHSTTTPPAHELPQARALWSWTGEEPGTLTIAQGNIIDIIEENNSEWWTGRVGGRQGSFLASYVEKLQVPSSGNASTPGVRQARALWSWAGENPGDLAFSQGDIIEVIRENDLNWSTGRLGGRQGLFPLSYVETIGPPPPPY
ncbi:hypothetical protein NP233_g10585 [Leucocoprinus birnbaumii]|uniref:Uncharacterized protein n=1 Tax=Leucocoprinus birnbaumii TaxID=56174 RepID=A0AAD5YM15_9AGAR|nr:hypothetical protein NP233_g10585 [Leucocoprinus birnbaumii]